MPGEVEDLGRRNVEQADGVRSNRRAGQTQEPSWGVYYVFVWR